MTLIDKVLALRNPKAKQLVYTYFNLYDLDPLLTLISIKYSSITTRQLLSFHNNQPGIFTYLEEEMRLYSRMIQYENL